MFTTVSNTVINAVKTLISFVLSFFFSPSEGEKELVSQEAYKADERVEDYFLIFGSVKDEEVKLKLLAMFDFYKQTDDRHDDDCPDQSKFFYFMEHVIRQRRVIGESWISYFVEEKEVYEFYRQMSVLGLKF